MPKAADLTGLVVFRLTVIRRDGSFGTAPAWYCQCECGNTTRARTGDLQRGFVKSCGCWKREAPTIQKVTHGHARQGNRSSELSIWSDMVRRCSDPNRDDYKYYGGRGITVCARWAQPGGFPNFFADMGSRPPHGSLERKDCNGNYEPSNCIWLDKRLQNKNKRNTVYVTVNGVTMCASDWDRKMGLPPATICNRLAEGWSHAEAVHTPLHGKRRAS